MLVNADRMLTNPVLLELKRQLEDEKKEKERLAQERQAEREKRKAEKEQQEEEKRRKQEEREKQKKENEIKAQKEKEEKAKRQEEAKRQREKKKRREEEEKEARRRQKEEEQRRQREAKKQQEEEEKEARRKRKEEERKRKREEEADTAAKKESGKGAARNGGGESSRDSWETHQASQPFMWATMAPQTSMGTAQTWHAGESGFGQQWGLETVDRVTHMLPFDFSGHTNNTNLFNSTPDMQFSHPNQAVPQSFPAHPAFHLPTANRTWPPVPQQYDNMRFTVKDGNKDESCSDSDEEER
jgi:hypothetical protein